MSELKTKTHRQSDLDFRLMALSYKVRDFIRPRQELLEGLRPVSRCWTMAADRAAM
jgi:hypothetical protein